MSSIDTDNTKAGTDRPEKKPRAARKTWNWHPDLPIENAPIFVWPPKPLKALASLASNWIELTGRVFITITAIVSWFYFHPALERSTEFAAGWMAEIYLRNLCLIVLVAGVLHLYFFSYAKQGDKLRFDARPMIRNGGAFSFRDQVKDNILWSIASGVTIWSAYEIFMMWSLANGYVPSLAWEDNPVWFVAVFVLVPLWYSFHFYWVHRLLHWPPLYRLAHSLHHRNINVGPWSGMSMHPVEHALYFSSVLIHFVLPTHPLHIIYHLQFNSLIAVITHSGYESLLVKDKKAVPLGYFFHQLHHRYFECNYGTDEMPWDKWFGTFHDGTEEATEMVRERRRRMYGE